MRSYLAIRLRDDVDNRSIHKLSIGDLDGEGEYDFVVKRPGGVTDPGRVGRSEDTFKVERYRSDGTFLWRNDLGWSIELGTWYSPRVVYDFSGDGKADVALKTGEGDPRDENGRVLMGPEYLSVWDGLRPKEIARAPWIERGESRDWGDTNSNRMSRNLMAIAYLDGKTPSVLSARGTYGLMKMDAWFLKDGQLHKAWHWTNQTSGFRYQGQGQHTSKVADVDGDGADEILNGAIAIDNDGADPVGNRDGAWRQEKSVRSQSAGLSGRETDAAVRGGGVGRKSGSMISDGMVSASNASMRGRFRSSLSASADAPASTDCQSGSPA